MSAKRTVHVYGSNGVWTVKKEGVGAKTFATRREAVTAARQSIRRDMGQFVVHAVDGGIRKYETCGMTPIQHWLLIHDQETEAVAAALHADCLSAAWWNRPQKVIHAGG